MRRLRMCSSERLRRSKSLVSMSTPCRYSTSMLEWSSATAAQKSCGNRISLVASNESMSASSVSSSSIAKPWAANAHMGGAQRLNGFSSMGSVPPAVVGRRASTWFAERTFVARRADGLGQTRENVGERLLHDRHFECPEDLHRAVAEMAERAVGNPRQCHGRPVAAQVYSDGGAFASGPGLRWAEAVRHVL